MLAGAVRAHQYFKEDRLEYAQAAARRAPPEPRAGPKVACNDSYSLRQRQEVQALLRKLGHPRRNGSLSRSAMSRAQRRTKNTAQSANY